MKEFTTRYTAMNPHHCVACWKCIESCPKKVIGKVGFLWHKHASFKNANACIGCKKCIKVCPHGVFSELGKENNPAVPKRNIYLNITRFITPAFIATTVTGIGLHIAGHNASHDIWHNWAIAHVISSLLWLLTVIPHIKQHFYSSIKEFIKNNWFAIALSILFLILAITGFILLIYVDGANSITGLRHYWLGISLFILTVIHIIKVKRK